MAVTNLLKQQVDQPVFEWMRFCPVASGINGLFGLDGQTGERFLYQIGSAASVNYRYDTYSDSWQEISPCQTSISSTVKGKVSKSHGHRGHVISATSNTITTGGWGFATKNAIGKKIRIISGTGAGQERTITAVADPVIAEVGVTTSATANVLTESTKKWRVNQWDGYSVRVQYNSTPTVITQTRKILYNDTTSLTVFDTNFQPQDPYNNTPFNSISPFTAPSTIVSYVIESVTLTVDSSWTVTPDGSSVFMILGTGLWIYSPTASQTLLPQFYDISSDTWFTKTGIASSTHYSAALSSYGIAFLDEANGAFVSGVTATSATTRTLVNTGATMTTDRYANHELRIVSGTGIGQKRRIVGHGATLMHIERNWDITPDSTSGYEIWADTDKVYVNGNGTSSIYQYSQDADLWVSGQLVDYGVARNISVTPYAGVSYGAPHQGFGVTSIVRTTSGILSGAINAAGTNYVVGDLVTCSTTGTNGQFYVTSVGAGGAVTGLQLAASGSGYSNGSSNTTGGAGSGLTITLTVGTTALVTTASNHDFRDWGTDQVKIAGCATDTSFNAVFTVIGVGSSTTFSIAAPSSSASPTAANSQSTTLIVDAEKNWIVNEHTGKVIFIYVAGTAPTMQSRRITSNTANTITVSTAITAATNGTSRYAICEMHGLGAANTSRVNNREPYGWATSGTATTLVDSTKDWRVNQWVNCRVRIVAGTGLGNESAITANTNTTLTVASWGVATPDATSKYEIMDSYGIVTTGGTNSFTDSAKNWVASSLVGKRVKIVAGTLQGTEATITANTATTITAAVGTTDTSSVYVVYEPIARGVAAEKFDWLCGLSDQTQRGRKIISMFAGAAAVPSIDLYDIPSNTWNTNLMTAPSPITLGSGTMYAYDNADSYFITVGNTGRIYQLDIPTMSIFSSGITPYAHGTVTSRDGIRIVTTDDGLKYLYVQRHSGFEMWRTLKFW